MVSVESGLRKCGHDNAPPWSTCHYVSTFTAHIKTHKNILRLELEPVKNTNYTSTMRVCVSLLTGFCEFSCVAEAALQASDSVQSSHGHFSSLSLNPPPGQVCTEQTEGPLPCLGHFYNNKNMFYLCNFIFDTTNSKIIQICLVLNEQGNTLFLDNTMKMLYCFFFIRFVFPPSNL